MEKITIIWKIFRESNWPTVLKSVRYFFDFTEFLLQTFVMICIFGKNFVKVTVSLVAKELIWRNVFMVVRENFSFFHTLESKGQFEIFRQINATWLGDFRHFIAIEDEIQIGTFDEFSYILSISRKNTQRKLKNTPFLA